MNRSNSLPPPWPILAIVGQTASGKTDLALRACHYLATELPHFLPEIISADAYQLYRGMDIGTAKITPAEQAGIIHHQLDVLEIPQPASVAKYQSEARRTIAEIYQRGHTPVLVGGSGLYIRAVLDRISFPGTDPQIRAELKARAQREGIESLFKELSVRDPLSSSRINIEDSRRVIRALEVCLLSGKPFSATLPDYTYFQPTCQFGLKWGREMLDRRIRIRSQKMVEDGFLDEVERLLARGLATSPTAARATGYQAAIACLAGQISRSELVEQIATETSRLAHKQWKWFKRDPRITWLEVGEEAGTATDPADRVSSEELLATIKQIYRQQTIATGRAEATGIAKH